MPKPIPGASSATISSNRTDSLPETFFPRCRPGARSAIPSDLARPIRERCYRPAASYAENTKKRPTGSPAIPSLRQSAGPRHSGRLELFEISSFREHAQVSSNRRRLWHYVFGRGSFPLQRVRCLTRNPIRNCSTISPSISKSRLVDQNGSQANGPQPSLPIRQRSYRGVEGSPNNEYLSYFHPGA